MVDSTSSPEEPPRDPVPRTSKGRNRPLPELAPAVLELARDAVVITDGSARIVELNPAAANLLGRPRNEVPGRKLFDLIRLESKGSRSLILSLISAPGSTASKSFEIEARRPDGTLLCAETVIARLPGTAPCLFAFYIRDITAQKQSMNQIKVLNEIQNAILTGPSMEVIAKAMIGRLRSLLPFSTATILLFGAERRQGKTLASWAGGRLRAGRNATLPMEHPSLSEMLEARHEGRALAWLEQFFKLTPGSLRSVLVAPLAAGRLPNGVVYLAAPNESAFSPDDREIARTVSGQLSVAIRNAQLIEQLSASRKRLHTLSMQMVEVQEAERREIARELHDEIGQALTGLKMLLEIQAGNLPEASRDLLNEPRRLTAELLRQVQKMSLNLRPQMLEDLGLVAALEWHFRRYTVHTGIEVLFVQTYFEDGRLPIEVERPAYRLVQEALTNVARHAGVRKVTVRLWTDHGLLGIQVEDGGTGFDPQRVWEEPVSTGLLGMRERVMLLGGYFHIDSRPGYGTRLTVELPYRDLEIRSRLK